MCLFRILLLTKLKVLVYYWILLAVRALEAELQILRLLLKVDELFCEDPRGDFCRLLERLEWADLAAFPTTERLCEAIYWAII